MPPRGVVQDRDMDVGAGCVVHGKLLPVCFEDGNKTVFGPVSPGFRVAQLWYTVDGKRLT